MGLGGRGLAASCNLDYLFGVRVKHQAPLPDSLQINL